jgi:isopenicillin N synthase-like dioxygenase
MCEQTERRTILEELDVTADNDANVVLVNGYVPVINLGLHEPPDPVRRRAVASAIAEACETSGFFTVTGHGVPEETISGLHRVAREFFGQPEHMKQLIVADPMDPLGRGYDTDGKLERFGATRLGEPRATEDAVLTSPNRWPAIPGFRETCLAYYGALSTLSLEIMSLMAAALRLPTDWFDDKFDHQMTPLTINYYPPLTEPAPPEALRHDAHTDFGAVTLLHQDDGPGALQVLDHEKQWQDVAPIPGTFVVNLGRLMTRWTNDRWPSTVHRVLCPPPEQSHRDRVSIAFFCQPNADAVISCIPTCADEHNPARHADISSGDDYVSRMRRAYLRYGMEQRSTQSDAR